MANWTTLGPCDCCGPAYPYPYYPYSPYSPYSPYGYPYSGGGDHGTCCNGGDLTPFQMTITAADDPIIRYFTEQGYPIPSTFALPINFSSVELCGGDVGAFQITGHCVGNELCLSMGSSGPGGYLLAADCVTKLYDQCITSCGTCSVPPGSTGTVTYSNYVCDNGKFISVDFVFHTSIGNLYGTVSI